MECITLCFYLSLAYSVSNEGLYNQQEVESHAASFMPGTYSLYLPANTGHHLGNVTLGLENKYGLFLEVDHTSGINTPEDEGWEEVKIGFRKKLELFR